MIKNITYRFMLAGILLIPFFAKAQQEGHEGYLFVRNTSTGLVELKWITNKVLYKEGYNLYKDDGNGNWQKLNATPFIKPSELPAEITSADNLAEPIFKMIDQEPSFEAFQEGMARLFLLIRAVKNNDFARAIGLAYLDEQITSGEVYKYRLTAMYNGSEIEIADTSIVAGPYVQAPPPQNVELDRKKKHVDIKWKIDKLSYYGVLIYKTNMSTGETELLTKEPVVVTDEDLMHENGKHPNYIDYAIDKETDYTYELKVMDYFGEEGKGTGAIPAAAKDFDPPMEPFNLKFDQDTLKVHLTWMSVLDDDRYGFNLYRFTDTITNKIKMNQEVIPPDKEFYWDVVNKPGEYYYVVAAVDLAGNEAYSGAIIAHVRDVIPPKPPTNLKTETDSGKVMLRWDPSPDNDLMGYVIYKVIEGEEFHPEHYTLINDVPVKETNYIEELHKNVKTAFRYVVEAVDTSYNRSVFSTFSVARLPDHLPPVSPFIRNVTLAENGNEIVIEWEANKDDDIYGYNLFRVDGTDSLAPKNILNLAPFLKSELKYSDEAISPGTKYTYFLQALDSSRNISDWSNGFSALVPGKSVSDGIKLKSFSAKMRGAKTVDLKWKANDPEHVLGYVIFRKEGDNNFMPLTGTLEEGKYKDKSVKSGLVYQYQVRMYASDGGIVKSENKEFKIPDDEK